MPNPTSNTKQPLFSVMCFCKNGGPHIQRCIESVLGQTYKNFEFVIQDGASSDDTLEILRRYDDPRIKLISEPDAGTADAFWKVINRCQGDYIATCLSDEELLPHALERALELFDRNPDAGAITCDGYFSDHKGNITGDFKAGDFDFVSYLFGTYCPLWPASFFRRHALLDIGLKHEEWNLEALEFQIWCRLATKHYVKYVPEFMAKYGIHPQQLSNTPRNWKEHVRGRLSVIGQLLSGNGFAGPSKARRTLSMINQLILFFNHASAYKQNDDAAELYRMMKDLYSNLDSLERHRFDFLVRGRNDMRIRTTVHITHLLRRMVASLPLPHRLVDKNPAFYERLDRGVAAMVYWASRYLPREQTDRTTDLIDHLTGDGTNLKTIFPPKFPASLYAEFANCYFSRGQVQQAQEMWQRAQVLDDSVIDGLACQAMLCHPRVTNEELLALQTNWAQKHAASTLNKHTGRLPINLADRKIRIGYHCSFMDADTIRYMMGEVLRNHDRSRFEIYSYSTAVLPTDIAECFDIRRDTKGLPKEAFADLIRSDQIDILVELTGFSPGHRYRALALRCAPIQISYLNHTGTSGVENIDYVLADDICITPGEDKYFTEKVWRLPGSFFCFNYDRAQTPEPVPPPSLSSDRVVFGYFGSGGKVSGEQIRIWAQLLKRSPKFTLYIKNNQLNLPDNRRFMIERFTNLGVAREQLIVEPGGTRQQVLDAYSRVDISLDTWPYCGGNTIAESIWQGVPVVTLKGNRFSSRYGASLVTAAGCPELIANSSDEYVDIAATLALSPQRLVNYRRDLRSMAKVHGLCDAQAFARKFEDAFLSMISRVSTSSQQDNVTS